MKSFFRILIAIVVVCALLVGQRGPKVHASSPIATAKDTDRDALVALYEDTDGDNWANNRNWLSNAPLDSWHGVTTDRNDRVVELDLSENELKGTIPPELGSLTNLEMLDLSENQLRGTIPPELGNLTNLEVLNLFENRLSGTIPSELGNLSNLGGLALSKNNLRGTIPSDLAKLNSLTWLILWGNQLDGSIPSELGRLTNLVWLYLSENRLSGTIPSELGNLTNLEELNLWGNQLSGAIPSELGQLTNLTDLALSSNRLSGAIPPELGNLINLEGLFLWDNELSGTVPPELEDLSGLTQLFLSKNRLGGCLPEVWRDIEDSDLDDVGLQFCSDRDVLVTLYEATDGDNWLENRNWLSNRPIGDWYGVTVDDSGRVIELILTENELNGAIPPELGNLTKLEALDLAVNQLRGTIPLELVNLSRLTHLFLYSNQLTGSISPELSKLAKLEQLALSWNRLGGTVPPELGKLARLEMLVISGNRLTGNIPPELGNLARLKALAIHVNRLTGNIPPELNKLSGLELLFLADNRLNGCIPEVWQDVRDNDLDEVDLPICTDEDALIALYEAADGDNWVSNRNWLSNRPIGTWYGVVTDENDRVIELDLSDNELKGTIPSELGHLAYLEGLYLSENQLSGSIPSALSVLSNLIELDLWTNELTGPIPPELGRLANLEMLHLGKNELSGTIPPELGNLTRLEELGLHSNKLTGLIPPTLDKLSNLAALYLGQNRLTGTIPAELGNLTNLEQLFLHSNKLSGAIPSELGNLTKLAMLSLWGNGLSGTMPSELGNLTKLTGLGLADNKLSGDIPPELGRLSKLEQLYLSGNRLGGCVPAVLENVEGNDFEELELPFCFATASTASTSAATAEQVSSARIFEMVSPAIAFIHTGISSGSGVLVEGGYVVTNAHVVWPFDAVRVAFPDGTAIRDVPVIGWDLLVDLAVVGPVPVDVDPVPLLDGEDIPIGSEVYLIGYPAEVEAYPQTTMTRGILSRLREWEPVGITYFQTDAAITGGQSGGALVSETGAVIGISGFRAFVEFGLAASSADLLPRVLKLIAGGDPSGLGRRELNLDGGSLRHRLTSQNYGDAYIINEPAGTAIEIRFVGGEDVGFQILDNYGNEHADAETGSLSFVTRGYGPLFLIPSYVSGEVTLAASHQLMQFDDPDRGKEIQVGQILHGNIDFPTDIDYLFLDLQHNEKVEIVVRSILADTQLTLWGYQGETLEVWIRDENSGGGLFGKDARIVFQAPFTGNYVIGVANVHPRSYAPAGYLVSVDQARAAALLTSLRPWVTINTRINVREGPGTNYAILGTAPPGERFVITGKSPGAGDWWQIDIGDRTGWVYGPLVTATNAQNVQVVSPSDR